jgi:ABC-type phosphonate transport system ATPase subunit
MIEVEKLTKRYGPVTAVDGLTFTARPGHVTDFLGPNGAGGAVAIGGNRCRWPTWTLLPYGQRTGRILCRRRPRRLTVLSPAAAAPTVARP